MSDELNYKLVSKEIADKIYDKYDIKRKGSNYFVFNGNPVAKTKVYEKFVKSDFELISENPEYAKYIAKFGDTLSNQIIIELENTIFNKTRGDTSNREGFTTDIDIDNLVPLIDLYSGNNYLFDTSINRLSAFNFKAYLTMLPADRRKLELDTINPAVFEFDPYNGLALTKTEVDGYKTARVNLYNPPEWQIEGNDIMLLSPEEASDLYCPPIISDFLEFLFPHKESRMYVMYWMYYALTSRCETYLVLNGAKGIGKGIFCNTLLMNLIGEDNYRLAPESLLDSIFNSALDKTRLLVLDEVSVKDMNHLNRLKKYANSKQNIERKGVDADKVIETYSSQIISNNSITDMFLEWDERRFSVPELTDQRLDKHFGEDRIKELIDACEDVEIMRQFGFWLLYNYNDKKKSPFDVYKGDKYYRIVYNSLTEWKKAIVEVVIDGNYEDGIVDIKDVKRKYSERVGGDSKFPTRKDTIKAFLDDYRHEGKYRIGDIEWDEEEKKLYIVPDDHWLVGSDNDDATGLL